VGQQNGNSLFPFTIRTVDGPTTRYAIALHDALSGLTTTLAPSNTGYVGSTNDAGDVLFDGGLGDLKLYRYSEQAAYTLYDMLDADAKAELSPPMIYGWNALVNDSNVAGVPAADPYDHLAAGFMRTLGDGRTALRGFVLTPVVKQP
jgi:hypothetical protein